MSRDAQLEAGQMRAAAPCRPGRALGILLPGLAAALLALVLPSAVQARVDISSPTLVPSYSGEVSDFTVRCSDPVAFSVQAGPGEKVSLDGRARRGGSFSETVGLKAGQSMRIRTFRGRSVRTQFVRCLPPDFPLWKTEIGGRPQAQWYVITTGMKIVPGGGQPFYGIPYVAVIDRRGVPVWWFKEERGNPMDAKFFGSRSILWYARDVDGALVHDLRGRVTRRVKAVDAFTDQHDISRTRDGGYLVVGAKIRDCPRIASECVDLREWGGPEQATVLDNEVQKLDRRGRLEWRWSTRGNVGVEEVATWIGSPFVPPLFDSDGRRLYDLFHINSVEEDRDGAVLSVRHMNALLRLGRKGRAIDWKLGGTPTDRSLRVEGVDGAARLFEGQHDARIQADGTISVLNNGSLEWRTPKMMRFKVSGRRAKLVQELSDKRPAVSLGGGSARRLSGGNWVSAWGVGSSLFSELTPAGKPVLSVTLPDGLISYRVAPVAPGRVLASDLRAGMDRQYPR